jgi:arylsulfatase A-like enzyme
MNVVVFALRGCPVAALGPYGNEWIATPNLDRLAAESVVFDRHISDCPDPDAAGRAWRTGRHQMPPLPPSPLGGEGSGARSEIATPHPNPPPQGGREQEGDLIALLKTRGVRTALVRHDRPGNDAHADFYAGWGELFDARPDPADRSPADALLRALPAALDRLAGSADWLLWVEIDRLLPQWDVQQDVFEVYIEELLEEDEEPAGEGEEDPDAAESEDVEDAPDDEPDSEEPEAEPVTPWTDPPTGWFDKNDLASWELLHRSFAAVVTVFDAELGRVFELLRSRGLDRSAVWVLTADRGLPLGEHGLVGPHRPWLHEELVHVPLVVRLPEAAEAGRRVPALTQPSDLAPTLLAWFGAEPPPGVHGVSLLPLLYGRAESVRAYACSGLVLGPSGEWAIRTPEWVLLLPAVPHSEDAGRREPMLFEKPDDRWEVNDLRPRHLELSEELEAVLRKAVELAQQPGPAEWPGLPGRQSPER